jgi:hypothetical protein
VVHKSFSQYSLLLAKTEKKDENQYEGGGKSNS